MTIFSLRLGLDFPGGPVVKNLPAVQEIQKIQVPSLGQEDTLEEGSPWQPIPVFLPGESHGQRSLADYSPWDHKELDTMSDWAGAWRLGLVKGGVLVPLLVNIVHKILVNEIKQEKFSNYLYSQSCTQLKWLSSSSSNRHDLLKNILHNLQTKIFRTSKWLIKFTEYKININKLMIPTY